MKQTTKYITLIALIAVVFFSCKKEKQPNTYLGYDYFPNNVGHYVIYECDSEIVGFSNNIPPFVTSHYKIKELIDSQYYNNQGQLTQRIVRYKIYDTAKNQQWSSIFTPEKVWSGYLLPNMAVRQEDNYPYIKLIFPMSLNEQWNGNSMNNIGTYNYQYTSLNSPLTINGVHFDSTLTVMQLSLSTYLGSQFYEEQYATGVGLIFKEVVDWQTASNFLSFTSPPPLDSAKEGTIMYTETYLSSGNQ